MDTIVINDLVVEGVHGLTEKERSESQRFKVDLALIALSKAHRSDSIGDALDYRVARNIVREIVRNTSFHLMETLAHALALNLLEKTGALSVTVTISKMDIWGNGSPAVQVRRDKNPSYLRLKDFDIQDVLETILENGAVSIPILPDDRREELFAEARTYEYQRQPELVGGGKVREQLSSISSFPEESLFYGLKNDFTELLLRKLVSLPARDIFSVPLIFNEMSIQKYEAGSIGITPHMDGKSVLNLICLFILTGTSEFAVCQDRSGRNPKFFNTAPGNLIILRAAGFYHSTFRPFHFVRNITKERFVFGLRQKISL